MTEIKPNNYAFYDKAVIVSGDGDFACLAEYLIQHDKLEVILAPNRKYSSLFRKYSGYVHVLHNAKEHLEYHKNQKTSDN